jgi:O-antigen/teichoic acid export membrane protein
LIVAPAPIITLALGAKWVGAALSLRWLALALLVQPLLFAQNWLMMSRGHGGKLCVLATANFALLLALCFTMRDHGIAGIASATAIAAIAVSLPGMYWATRESPVAIMDASGALRRPLLLAVVFGVSLGGTLRALGSPSNGHTVIALLAAGAVWASLAIVWKSARQEWSDAVRAFGMAAGKLSV